MIRFGDRIEMMVDRFLLQDTDNVRFCKTEPLPLGKALGFDRPWEGLGSLGLTVFDDAGTVKCYYRGFPDGQSDYSEKQVSCLAVSSDGIRFTPYPINEIPYGEWTQNNILRKDTFCHNFAPFLDPNPNCRPQERYKAIGGLDSQGGIHVFGSPDGIHWHMLADGPVITKGHFDSMNLAFWNPHTKLYHCYFRWNYRDVTSPEFPNLCRGIHNCTSEDFIHWSDPRPNEYEEGLVDQLYTNAATPVPGAEHILVSFPMRFHEMRKKIQDFEGNPYGSQGVSDAVFMSSRDGVHWDRTWKDAWLAGGLYSHEWTQRNFITLGGIIVRGDSFLLYTEKNYMWEDDGIWVYSIPKYRFLSLYADNRSGCITTKPLHFVSDDLFLNYSTSAYGHIRITVTDMDGRELFQSDKIYGNELSHKLHIENLSGSFGTLKIELKEAHLYAMGSAMS